MAVYNPYDQVIFDDPAYLTDPEKAKEQIQEETRGIADIIARTAGPIAGLVTDPEGYQQTLDQEQKNKQILEQLGITNRQLTRDELERAKAAGYDPLTTGQALGKISGFLYSDLVKGSENIRSGVDYYDLPENERMGVAMGLIDLADIALLPAVFKKLATIGVKKFGGKTNLKTIAQDPEIQKQFPAETQEILSITGGGFTPAGVMRAAEDGTGPASSMPKGLQIGHEKASAGRLEKKNRLLKVINEAKESGKKYKQKLDIYKEAGISKFVGKDLGDQFPEIRQDTDFLINKPDKSNKDVVLDFLKQNPNKKYTIGEIAESTGLEYKQVNKIKEMNRKEIADRFVSPKDEGRQRRNDIREYLNNLPEGSYVPSDFLAKEFNTTANEVGVFLQTDPQYRSKVRMANTFDFGFDRGFETVPQFLMKYIDDTMNDGRFHYRDEILDVDFNGNKISGKQLSAFFQNYKDYKKYFAPTEFQQKTGKGRDIPRVLNNNKEELGYAYVGSGPRRAEYNFLYDYLRSADPNLYPDFKGNKEEFLQMLVDDLKSKNWKELYREDINTIRELDKLREVGTEKIKNLFDTYSEQYPQQFKNLDKGDFVLHLAHNFPLQLMRGDFGFAGSLKGSTRLSLARTNLEHHREIEEEIAKIVKEVNQKYVDKGVGPQQRQKIPPEINKKLTELDKKANKLGTVVYFKFGNQQYKVGNEIPPSVDDLVKATEKYFQYVAEQKAGYKPRKTDKNFGDVEIPVGAQKEGGDVDTLTKAKGGEVKPVRMAIGGDPLMNMNQQQYSPDPAFDEDYFQQAVESGNLQAANIFNLFKVFKKPKVMATPSNIKQVEEANQAMPQAVPGSQEIAPMQPGRPDFFFKSFLLDQLNSKNAPKASTPQGWREFLIKGRNVPEAEMLDTGILQYLEDTEKFYPNKKITRDEIESLYDMSPLGNLEVRVKDSRRTVELDDVPVGENTRDFLDFNADQGRAKHKGAGRATIDAAADDYFEVVVNVPQLPGQEKAFINSGHFEEPNVLGFTRVGTYKNADDQPVAVIQEMQTDMLTEVRKEQERLSAMVKGLRRYRNKLVNDINNMPPQNTGYYENELRVFDQKYPPDRLAALESDNLIQPFPNIVAKDLIPEKTRSLNQIQEDINQLTMANVEQYRDPAYKTKIFDLAQEQQKIVDDLMSMNRTSNYEEMLKDFRVPSTTDRSELDRIANTDTYLPSDYQLKKVQSFPPIPFNKQADYVDLLIKSTIKAAKQKGIDKVAIMPADVGPNPRWGKDSDEAKKKFQNLYDKVGVQQLKNIAKKYGGKLEVEKIIDSSKGTKGLTFLNKNPDGEFQILKQAETRKEVSDADRDEYYDEQITRVVKGITEPGDVVYSREIAPGQVMDYYVVQGRGDATDVGYRFIPLKEGENANDALIKIEEYNPSAVDMYTISFDPSKLEEPMYLFKKKSGGSIDKDSLVSITDIYGEYGR